MFYLSDKGIGGKNQQSPGTWKGAASVEARPDLFSLDATIYLIDDHDIDS